MEPYDSCVDWSEPIPSEGDPYAVLVPYWWALLEMVFPIRGDALVAREWKQIQAALDQEPIPPVAATFVWNMRWRTVVCFTWTMLIEEHGRRQRRPQTGLARR